MTDAEEQELADNDLRALMNLELGRRFLWRQMEFSISSTFAGEETHTSAFNEGRRAIAAELMADCQRVAPQEFVHMLGDAFAHREAERLAAEKQAAAKVDEEPSDAG